MNGWLQSISVHSWLCTGSGVYTLMILLNFHMEKRLYVGNLSWGTNEDGLREAFSPFGNLTDVFIVKDRERGNRSKGFGFVTFSDADDKTAEDSMNEAIEALHEQDLDGREIIVNEARPREENNTF